MRPASPDCTPGAPLSTAHRARLLLPALVLALAWGLLPAAPALARGELLGTPWTDLYPSVWGLWAFARSPELLPTRTDLLGFPEGMGWLYSSPIKGTLARLLLPGLGLVATWNALVLGARVATVLAAWAAARAWGLGAPGALLAAAVYGCAPFFHGYAVEGIAEGTDGWTLALWAWAIGRRRWALAVPLMALTIASSWYLGAAGLLLAALLAPWRRGALWSLLAPALVAPLVLAFTGAFPAMAPLPDAVRAAMGAPLLPRAPGLLPGVHPFALCAWVGLVVPALLLTGRSRLALLALVPAALSLGVGPWYELPGLELLRFPYRLHAATLAILALAAGRCADALAARRGRLPALLGPLVAVEGLLLSPVEPLLPGAPADIPALYAQVDGPVLELPGPVASPPGEIDRSRPRARYLLYFQAAHGQPSPWVPPFNAVGVEARAAAVLAPLQRHDPLVGAGEAGALPPGNVEGLRALGLRYVVIQRRELGQEHAAALLAGLQAQGATVVAQAEGRTLLRLAVDTAPTGAPPQGGAGPEAAPGPAPGFR